ncbi:MAG: MATE family efflux transporter, partial [Clostridia bacterium]|nr:MATE family efflux transporter [Clostridia bacterium]
KSVLYCGGVVTVLGMVIGGITYIFCEPLLKMFVTNPEAIAFGMERLKIMCLTYFMCGMMEVGAGALRGINKSAISMCGSLIGACGLRIVWIYTVFAMSPSIFVLYISYPVTWLVTGIFLNCMFFYFVNKNKYENKISA